MSKRSAPKKQVESKTEPEVKETVEQTKKTTKKAQKVEPVVEAPKPETPEKKPRKKVVKEEKPVEEVKEAAKEAVKEAPKEVKPKQRKAKETPKVEEPVKVEEAKTEEPAKKTRKVKSKDTAVKEEVAKPEKKVKAVKKAVVKKDKEPVVESGVDNAELVDDEFAENNPKKKNYRHFKLIFNGSEPTGRFSGTKPKQASNKALSSIYKGGYSETGEIKFSIVECTQGSKRKQYNYIGERVKLDHPMVVPIKKGGEKSITYNYNNKVRKDKDPIIIHA